MPTLTEPKDIASALARAFMDYVNEATDDEDRTTLERIRENIERIVRDNENVESVKVTNRGQRGACLIRVYGHNVGHVANVTLKADGTVDVEPVDSPVAAARARRITPPVAKPPPFSDKIRAAVAAARAEASPVDAPRELSLRNVITGSVTWTDDIEAALAMIEVDPHTAATAEQRERAKLGTKPGLRGKARALWIATGATARVQGPPRAADGSRPRAGSSMDGACQVLRGRRKPMTVDAIYAAMVERGLAGSLQGKTPVATLSARLALANAKGQWVERPEPGLYRLRP